MRERCTMRCVAVLPRCPAWGPAMTSATCRTSSQPPGTAALQLHRTFCEEGSQWTMTDMRWWLAGTRHSQADALYLIELYLLHWLSTQSSHACS